MFILKNYVSLIFVCFYFMIITNISSLEHLNIIKDPVYVGNLPLINKNDFQTKDINIQIGLANEGIASDQNYYYTSRGTSVLFAELLIPQRKVISKFNSEWKLLKKHIITYDQFLFIPTIYHIGDICVNEDYVFAPLTDFISEVPELFGFRREVLHITWFDKNELNYINHLDLSSWAEEKSYNINKGDLAGLAIYKNHLYIIEFQENEPDAHTPRIFVLPMNSGVPNTSSITVYEISTYLANGIEFRGDYLYITSGYGFFSHDIGYIDVYRISDLSETSVANPIESYTYDTPRIHAEGLTYYNSELWIAQDDYVHNIQRPNHNPILSNPQVIPVTGISSSNFEFLVDYFDPDGDPPILGYRTLTINGTNRFEIQMDLKSGTESNGTYHYMTKLPQGSYRYAFLFSDGIDWDSTQTINGPSVYDPASVPINIKVNCEHISQQLILRYSTISGTGPWTDIPITKSSFYPAFSVPPGSDVWFYASVQNANFEFDEWNYYENGIWKADGNSINWHLTVGPEINTVLFDLFWKYTPQTYNISGTVQLEGGGLVPGGVTLKLKSPENSMNQNSTDGNYSFTGVKGGVNVTITPEAEGGYDFAPPVKVFNALKQNYTGKKFIAYISDEYVPIANFLKLPPSVSESPSVSFSWTGIDDVSDTSYLQYQYKLDDVDTDWSSWSSDTQKSYNLPNGAYTFWVRAKDEAENINNVPIFFKFVVNSEPKVTKALKNYRSVWSSRVTLEMPTGASNPTDVFVLLPSHSGSSDSELVPVRIHRADEIIPIGANSIVASELGLPSSIDRASMGWNVTLPSSIPEGQTADYDIVWGKTAYLGWSEEIEVPAGFPNYKAESGYTCHIEGTFLDDDHQLWRMASKNRHRVNGVWGSTAEWIFMDIVNQYDRIIDENLHLYQPGIPDTGTYAVEYDCQEGYILPIGSNICLVWEDEKYEKIGPSGDFIEHRYHSYGIEIYNDSGATVNSFEGTWQEDTFINIPKFALENGLYITGRTYVGSGASGISEIWFVLHDADGNLKMDRTVFESVTMENARQLECKYVRTLGDNIVFLFTEFWETDKGDDRQAVKYQVRDSNGNLVKTTASFNPTLLPDDTEQDDAYYLSSALTDNDGKVWVSYERDTSGPDEYYYSIIASNGTIWKGPIQLTNERRFEFCDRDGYIWTNEDGALLVLNNDDTIAIPARSNSYWPKQNVGSFAVCRDNSGNWYRLYDRWTPAILSIEVPVGVDSSPMELIDLNLWDNDLHPANLTLNKGDTSVWNQSGQFTGHTSADMSGIIDVGSNILTMAQYDFLGGQVFVTFPYSLTPTPTPTPTPTNTPSPTPTSTPTPTVTPTQTSIPTPTTTNTPTPSPTPTPPYQINIPYATASAGGQIQSHKQIILGCIGEPFHAKCSISSNYRLHIDFISTVYFKIYTIDLIDYLTGMNDLNEYEKIGADLNYDGKIDIADYISLLNKLY